MRIITPLLAITIALAWTGPAPAQGPKPPHIVVFLADDLGWADCSPHGGKEIRTPNMARLAAAGMTFTHAFVASPSCAPSRAALLTGLAPMRNGAMLNHSRPRPDIKKWPAYFRELGYEVAAIGKVAHYAQVKDYGFDHFSHFNYHQDDCIEAAVTWLAQRRSAKPLCLLVGTNWPHVPWPKMTEYDPASVTVPPTLVDTFATRQARARYATAVGYADRDLGLIYDAARKHLGDRICFLFTSDHGSQFPFGKWNGYDAGIRTPLVVAWPGQVKPGSRSEALVSWIDILPTCLEAAGCPPPPLSGRSFLPVLRGEKPQHRDAIFVTHSGDGDMNRYPLRAVRTRDWKYIRNLDPAAEHHTHVDKAAGGDGRDYWDSWVALAKTDSAAAAVVRRYHTRPAEELYDLKADPWELRNLAADPAHATLLTKLRADLAGWMKEHGDEGLPTERALPDPRPKKKPKPATANQAARPNVLLLCVDDLKPLLGCYGDKTVKSPNLDRLATRGLLFERAYCNQAVCAPSRNALLTGRRPQALGIYDLGTNFRKAAPDAVTLPQYFKQHGYRTEGLGKIFHVGHGNSEDPVSWSVPHWRADVVAYALPESKAKKGLTREEALFANKPGKGLPRGAAYEAANVPDNTYPDGALADEAVRRLRAAKDKPNEPFFLAVGFVKPHLPFCAPKKYWDLYDRAAFALPARQTPPDGAPAYAPQAGGELRQYAGIPEKGALPPELARTLIHGYHAAVSFMDAQLGRVLDALDETGLAKNTVIMVWGDHGWHLGDHGIWCKHTNYEQAARIPLLVVAPGATHPGSRSAALAETVDVFPTLAELAGLPTPQVPQGLDGQSLVPLLRDPTALGKQAIYHVYPRSPGGRQVLGRAVRTARHRLVEWKAIGAAANSAELELYDYEADPGETRNLATQQPEVVTRLRALLATQPEAKMPVRAQAGKK